MTLARKTNRNKEKTYTRKTTKQVKRKHTRQTIRKGYILNS